ncbi:MAG: hypothetical protein A3B31_01260 [Candidatus Komeilibacteria bacterium RIFCSPLOWO2_01_FULL_53_11]|uniref:Primosomal protein N' 3' DNA-binding domain-containing protein n=1 Tax=Candidatus Komeilibacteria bacterium RIFCSPLOWO2_01_FULL_53_11 TaxID=1798552 RepID=A0A1G2BS17_9BACT|nr:MAG: hypothetical protein A3B31_01260 [Candidatus Komeilibacteria bacterium RIFCSPLOWO2_01_FULL_53_11]
MTSPDPIAEVVPLRRLPVQLDFFSYRIPATLAKRVHEGSVVRVPFKNSLIEGVVTSLVATGATSKKLKDVQSVSDIVLTEQQLTLAMWLAEYYCISRASVLHSFLAPSPLRKRAASPVRGERSSERLELAPVSKTRVPDTGYVFYRTYREMVSLLSSVLQKNVRNGQTLILTPEHLHRDMIMHLILQGGYGSRTVVLPPKQQKNEFARVWAASTKSPIVVGSSHAAFLPFQDLKRIVAIEAEHQQFQRAEQAPRYHLADYIFKVADLHGATLLLTGFSPDIRLLAEMRDRHAPIRSIGPSKKPRIETIDLREERRAGNKGILSSELLDLLRARRRALLILNRHGETRYTYCSDCGFSARCEICGRPLTTAGDAKTLQCENCGSRSDMLLRCPSCTSTAIKSRGIGISALVRQLSREFQGRTVVEYSSRSPLSRSSLERADIVVATNKIFSEIISHFDVAAFVQIDADLTIPNYHAAESLRHYILKLASYQPELYIQTFAPEHRLLTTLHDVTRFYEDEMAERRMTHYPPFATIMKVAVRDSVRERYDKKLRSLTLLLKDAHFFGPFEKRSKRAYEAHVILRMTAQEFRKILDRQSSDSYNWFHVEINPFSAL